MSVRNRARIAIVHPWFLAHGGAEHVVDVLAELFDEADFFTLFYRDQDLPQNLHSRNVIASRFNWIPFKYTIYRYLLSLYPILFEEIDLRGYDIVITSDSCVAKGIAVDQSARHICYCHSPMRTLWDKRFEFRAALPWFARPFYTFATHKVRQWDFQAAQRVDHFIGNSKYVAERIFAYYRRSSEVIYPPVMLQKRPISDKHGDYYLSVGRLTETKRVDLLVQACNKLCRKLIVVGGGRQARTLANIAGPTVAFEGRVDSEKLDELYRNCRALLFAADEDFGIVPVEAQGYGRPVIAYGHGGSLETVAIEGQQDEHGRPLAPTGVFFKEQTVDSICEAILRFEAKEAIFNPKLIRVWAEKFDSAHFSRQIVSLVKEVAAEVSLTI